ncbi:MAG: 4-phosphopantetheinyl transferase [Planctomycetota bacterium]|jgi:holo-[acyl-carrier protein] synthase
MTILGIGTDLVEVARIDEALSRGGDALKARLFTADESAYCLAQPRPAEHFAARFAAKEAVMKAMGAGFGQGCEFHEIGVVRTESGAPTVVLSGKTAATATARGVARFHLSMSHTATHATAYAVAET